MRTTHDVFHLAIPVHDLDAAQSFYVSLLGCKLARRYPDRITVDFFGDQLVCHLTEGMSTGRPASLYPRHSARVSSIGRAPAFPRRRSTQLRRTFPPTCNVCQRRRPR
jgi:extradiol dioxygenase family protein